MRWTGSMLGLVIFAAPGPAVAQDEASVERGRYLAQIGGCNDCHTTGYAMSEGQVPEEEWLKGDTLGWRGPWGTTYPANLRLRLSEMTEDEWLEFARTFKTRPPMPWYDIQRMSEADIRSLHRFITSFEELGEPVPEYVPAGEEPSTPYIGFPAPPPQ